MTTDTQLQRAQELLDRHMPAEAGSAWTRSTDDRVAAFDTVYAEGFNDAVRLCYDQALAALSEQQAVPVDLEQFRPAVNAMKSNAVRASQEGYDRVGDEYLKEARDRIKESDRLMALIDAQGKPAEQGQRLVAQEPIGYLDPRVIDPDTGKLTMRRGTGALTYSGDKPISTWTMPIYAAPQPAVPEGWVLAPVEPTQYQVRACQHNDNGGLVTPDYRRAIYRAMLAAKPEAKG